LVADERLGNLTSVWSLALRRSRVATGAETAQELARLIQSYRVVLIGPIRQELPSGGEHAKARAGHCDEWEVVLPEVIIAP
jgi:hypothetical protein